MATLIQIGESTELAERKASLEPREPLKGNARLENTAFPEPKDPLKDTALFERTGPQAETPSLPTADLPSAPHLIHTLLRALASILIAPVLLAAALVVFLFALADFSWFRLRDLRNGPSHPKGLWEF
jgi:hypothetical protein